jgi:HAD superfamily hydrolase (TIGR01458 family)
MLGVGRSSAVSFHDLRVAERQHCAVASGDCSPSRSTAGARPHPPPARLGRACRHQPGPRPDALRTGRGRVRSGVRSSTPWRSAMLPVMFEHIRALLIDLDGVLYVEEEPIAGAAEALQRLREDGLGLRFVTNTTAHSRDRTLEKLARLKLRVDSNELVTPAALAVEHCLEQGHARVALIMNEEVKHDFAELEETTGRADAVIVGDLGAAFGYEVLNHAFRRVMGGAELIALQKNRYWMRADGLSLDVGPFVAAIEFASGREAYVVGKPAKGFFDQVLASVGVEASAAAMVGDDIESDIGGALRAGLDAILVRTGKYQEDRVRESGIQPTSVVDSIVDVPRLLTG